MKQHDPRYEEPRLSVPAVPGGGGSGNGETEDLRERARRLGDAADRVIDAGVSGNARLYVNRSRQVSGQ